MTDSIRKMRAAFDKAAIVITKNGISAVYSNRENEWVYQPDDESSELYSQVFYELLNSSDEFIVKFRKGFSISLEFRSEIDVDDAVFYNPISRQLSIEELHDTTSAVFENRIKNEEFIEFFSGVDLSDEDAVFKKLAEWIDSDNTGKNSIIDLPRKIRFNKMLTVLNCIQAYGFECSEVFEPEGKEDGGFLTLCFDNDEITPKKFVGKSKDALAELIRISSSVTFEANIVEGFINLSFFA